MRLIPGFLPLAQTGASQTESEQEIGEASLVVNTSDVEETSHVNRVADVLEETDRGEC